MAKVQEKIMLLDGMELFLDGGEWNSKIGKEQG